VLGRAEAVAMKEGLGTSLLDALGSGFGYSLILIAVAFVRELLGKGTLMGFTILPLAEEGGWYHQNALVMLAPSAFFIIGLMIWGIRALKPEQNEKPDFQPMPLPNNEKR
jgi:Na+-transporting NADH:ubiquinone oxidoreductase subunit D